MDLVAALAQKAAQRAAASHMLPDGMSAQRYERTLVERWRMQFSICIAKSMVNAIYKAVDTVPG